MKCVALFLFALSLAAQTTSPTKSWYVSPTGTGDGSFGNPASIADAIAGLSGQIVAGNRVWLRDGGGTCYNSPASGWNVGLNGSLGLPIVFRSYPGERACLDGATNTAGNGSTLFNLNGQYLRLQDVEAKSSHTADRRSRQHPSSNAGLPNRPAPPRPGNSSLGVEIINNFFHSNGGSETINASSSVYSGNVIANEGAIQTLDWNINDGSLVSIVVSGGTATVTGAWGHGYTGNGQAHNITGATGDPDLNQTCTVASRPTSTSFTCTVTNVSDGTYNNAGLRILSTQDSEKGQSQYREGNGLGPQDLHRNGFFNSFESCLQLQGSASGGAQNLHYRMIGNMAAQCGMFASQSNGNYSNQMLIGWNARCGNLRLERNRLWLPASATRGGGLSWSLHACQDVRALNNHIVSRGATNSSGPNRVVFQPNGHSGNIYEGWATLDDDTTANLAGNEHNASRPTDATPDIYYEVDPYDQQCFITILSWDGDANENVTLSQCDFPSGTPYEILDGFNPIAAPLVAGTYAGGTVSVPMNRSNGDVLQPIGWTPRSAVHPHQGSSNSKLGYYIARRQRTYRTMHFSFAHDTAAKVRLQYGPSNAVRTVVARPIETTVKRNTWSVSSVSNAAQPEITLVRPASFPVRNKTVVIVGITDTCWRDALHGAHTIGSGNDAPTYNTLKPIGAGSTSGCSSWGDCGANCSGIKILFGPNPISLHYFGSPIINGDAGVFSAGTGSWTRVNGTRTLATNSDGLIDITGEDIAPTMGCTVTTSGTTLTCTSHGLSANDWVWITAGTHNNKLRQVTSVTNGNEVVISHAFSPDIGAGVAARRIPSDGFDQWTGTIPALVVNRNPLMFDLVDGAFDPSRGIHPLITINGPTGTWQPTVGTHRATLVANRRFTIPIDASGFGSAEGQTFSISTPAPLDYPEIDADFSGGKASLSVPHLLGPMIYRWCFLDSGGNVINGTCQERTQVSAN